MNSRRQLEFRIIGNALVDVEEAMELIIKKCYPNAYRSPVKENDQGHYRFRGYITVVLSNREDTKSATA